MQPTLDFRISSQLKFYNPQYSEFSVKGGFYGGVLLRSLT